MVKILVVDDDAEKVRRVLAAICSLAGIQPDSVEVAANARDAKLKLANTAYDLLVLDIALPEWADSEPAPEGGLSLLKEVCERPRYNKPKQIVGLTAYPEVLVQAAPEFQQELWHVIQYDAGASDWINQLQRKVKYLLLAANNKDAVQYGCDLCVVTALQVPENAAVLDLDWNWKPLDLPNEVANFYSGTFTNGGFSRSAIAANATRMGMTAATIIAMKAIYNFRPRYLAMVGIAAGIRGECNLGDVIVADPTWDYGSGKWAARGSDTVFEISPHQIPLNAVLRNSFERLSRDTGMFDDIRNRWRGPKPETVLKMVIGPTASGSAVRADGNAADEVKTQHRKVAAIEMEAYGIMAAAHEAPLPEVRAFVAKSICDFADEKKTDDFRAYAAYTSASVLKVFAEAFLPLS